MAKLKADFKSDWIAFLRSHMAQEWGAEIADIDDQHIAIYYFDACRRRLEARPRSLKIADDFKCPIDERAGWNALQDKVLKGESLNPHLSTKHSSLLYNDGLLTEWNVHHFHLGLVPYLTNPYYVKRTDLLVFALISDTAFYAINIYPHKSFEKLSIIESIHRNWPELISYYRINGLAGESITELQRKSLRSKNANVLVSMLDGTVYGPLGSSVSSSGVKMESVRQADIWSCDIQRLQDAFETHLDKLMPTLRLNGYLDDEYIEAELQFTEVGYDVFLRKYGVLANLTLPSDIEIFHIR